MPARTGCSCSRQATTRTLWKTPPPSALALTPFPLLYKALAPDGNPEFATVLNVMRSLGLKLHAKPGAP